MSEPVASMNLNTGASDGSGRISVVTEPALPATCVLCSRSANGMVKFIDFNFNLDYYGAVVFCEDCMKECLHELEFVPQQKLAEVIKTLTLTVQELEVANSELDKYKSAMDGLSFIRPDLRPASLADDSQSEESNESTDDSESADEGSEQNESDSNGSDSGGGLKNISIFAD